MIAALETHLRDSWSQVRPGPAPRRLAFMKLGFQEYPQPTVPLLLLAFADAENTPCAVAKVSRDEAGDRAIEAEGRALEAVRPILPEAMRAHVPRLLHAGRLNHRPFLLMSALPGSVEMHNTWPASRIRGRGELILSALSWAMKLGQAAPAPPLPLRAWLDESHMAVVRDQASSSDWDPHRWQALEDRLGEAQETEWPAGFAHGDYFPGNLLFQRHTLSGVVDWAMASERLPLFFDVLTYEFSFCIHAARGGSGPNLAMLREFHALPAFSASRQRLRLLGISLDLGSAPRLATLLDLHRAALQWRRPAMARAFLRILGAETESINATAR